MFDFISAIGDFISGIVQVFLKIGSMISSLISMISNGGLAFAYGVSLSPSFFGNALQITLMVLVIVLVIRVLLNFL